MKHIKKFKNVLLLKRFKTVLKLSATSLLALTNTKMESENYKCKQQMQKLKQPPN